MNSERGQEVSVTQDASVQQEQSALSSDDLDRQFAEIEARLNQCFHDLYRAHMNLVLNCSSSPAGNEHPLQEPNTNSH